MIIIIINIGFGQDCSSIGDVVVGILFTARACSPLLLVSWQLYSLLVKTCVAQKETEQREVMCWSL